MRKSTLRKTTLLSLIGLSTQQSTTVTWGEPFTVANSATATVPGASPSTEALLPPSSHGSLLTDSISPVPSPSRTQPVLSASSDAIVISGIQSAASKDSTFSVSLATPSGSAGTVSTPVSQSVRTVSSSKSASSTGTGTGTGAATQSTAGAAAPVYKKMGVVGALAGAAGVLFV